MGLVPNFSTNTLSTSSLTQLPFISTPVRVASFNTGSGSGGTVIPLITSESVIDKTSHDTCATQEDKSPDIVITFFSRVPVFDTTGELLEPHAERSSPRKRKREIGRIFLIGSGLGNNRSLLIYIFIHEDYFHLRLLSSSLLYFSFFIMNSMLSRLDETCVIQNGEKRILTSRTCHSLISRVLASSLPSPAMMSFMRFVSSLVAFSRS